MDKNDYNFISIIIFDILFLSFNVVCIIIFKKKSLKNKNYFETLYFLFLKKIIINFFFFFTRANISFSFFPSALNQFHLTIHYILP